MATPVNLTIPVKLDAFVFNQKVCDGNPGDPSKSIPPDAKIAPITQPNYTFLRLDNGLIQNDILDHVDLHNAVPWNTNPRLVDLGQNGAVRAERLGVYVHWTIPRFYRSGVAATSSASPSSHPQQRLNKGFAVPPQSSPDYSSPEFPQLPNRWLVIRKLDPSAPTTVGNGPGAVEIDPVVAWVVESDRSRTIHDPTLLNADLQVDVSPYITNQPSKKSPNDGISIADQAEIFIGYKTDAQGWHEDPTADRADLTVLSASNPLFPDYQPHCSNVFSIVDRFECTIGGEPGSLSQASASYYVIGWHSSPENDPFNSVSSSVTRGVRLQNLFMDLNGSKPYGQDVQDWLSSPDPTRVLCHGAMYDVLWNLNELPSNVPSNDAAHHLAETMPVAVGTTPMDALLAYVTAQTQPGEHPTALEKDLFALAPLLRAQDDGVQAQRVADDELQDWNFSRTSGGVHWHFQNKAGDAAQDPTPTDAANLEKLNQMQKLWDSTQRQLPQVEWDLFSYWWKYVSLSKADQAETDLTAVIQQLTQQHQTLTTIIREAQAAVQSMSTDATMFSQLPQAGVIPEFGQSLDPTMLIAGVEAGWPDDYLDSLTVRLDTQLVKPSSPVSPPDAAYGTSVLPLALRSTAQLLVQEFMALEPPQTSDAPPSGSNAGDGDESYLPLYHDRGKHGDPTSPLRDEWGSTQPWFPLFVEWEAEYYHVEWDDWELYGETKSAGYTQWKMGIPPDTDLTKVKDTRTLSGRILLLPQPNFSLQTSVADLFGNTDPKLLDKYLPNPDDRTLVQTKTYTLPFLSAPLDGFTAQLLTLIKGTHIKPNARYPETGYTLRGIQPLQDAVNKYFSKDTLGLIGANTDLTPFGTLVNFSSSIESSSSSSSGSSKSSDDSSPIPFKPCTHGQFSFYKLNIVDKFGQTICAIDPRYGHEHSQAVYPIVSDYFAPGLKTDGQPNVVVPGPPGHCEFVQLPPAINQPARLNSCFVVHDTRQDTDKSFSYWRPTTEWENPIWGWIVLNYVDYGIQIFLPDGTFYREVRIASPTAPDRGVIGAKWLPFDPPTTSPSGADTTQLDRLLAKLTDEDDTYLLAFLDMLGASLDASTSAPSAYGSFLNSLVGRPMALVNAAWSLELASDSKKDQSTLDNLGKHLLPDEGLLPGDAPKLYSFPVKLGDVDRAHDGMVAYFKTLDSPSPDNEIDLSTIYTYYTGTNNGQDSKKSKQATATSQTSPLDAIGPDNFPTLEAFWLDPGTMAPDPTSTPPKTIQQSASLYASAWNQKLTVFGMIMDPFVPITSYTGGVLPIGNLQLPSWTWQQAMSKMTAFFHLGPVVVTGDVQSYWDPTKTMGSGESYTLDPQDQTAAGRAVGLPSLDVASWAWLQPYVEQDSEGDPETRYMALGLAKVDNKPGYETGPYTALEGYLQLRAPIVRPDAPVPIPKPSPTPPPATPTKS